MSTIFLSYAHEDFDVAQQLYFALRNLNHTVFFDKESLQVGEEYNFNIIDSIRQSDFSILLLSPDFFSENSFCKTELKIIQSNWPAPKDKIFPVMAREISFDQLPNYIKSVTILKIQGNLIAEVVQVIQDRVYNFSSSDSVSSKLRRLEIEKQLAEIDQEWSLTRKRYMQGPNSDWVPRRENGFGLCILFFVIGALGFVEGAGVGIITTIICGIAGIVTLIAVFSSAKGYEESEKSYLSKRNEIAKELPVDISPGNEISDEILVGAAAIKDNLPAADGVYMYNSGVLKLVVENGMIKGKYFLERGKNIVIEKSTKTLAQKGDNVFLDTGEPAPTGKYSMGYIGYKVVVENGKFVSY
jgi:hypothetical protein